MKTQMIYYLIIYLNILDKNSGIKFLIELTNLGIAKQRVSRIIKWNKKRFRLLENGME